MKPKHILTLACLLWQIMAWGQTPQKIADILPLLQFSATIGNKLLFNADDGIYGNELWITDGTKDGTKLVKDIFVGARNNSSYPTNFYNFNNSIFFVANDGKGRKLFKTDGTTQGTNVFSNVTIRGDLRYFIFKQKLLIIDDNNWVYETDGSTINLKLQMSGILGLTSDGNQVYFKFIQGNGRVAIANWDGVTSSVSVIRDFQSDWSARDIIYFKNAIYFSADDGNFGEELWRSDGTANGTIMVKNIRSRGNSSSPVNFIATKDRLYFMARDDEGSFIFTSDGTEVNTNRVKLRKDVTIFSPGIIAAANNKGYFYPAFGGITNIMKSGQLDSLEILAVAPAIRDARIQNIRFIDGKIYLFGNNSLIDANFLSELNTENDVSKVISNIKGYGIQDYVYLDKSIVFGLTNNYFNQYQFFTINICTHTAKINTPNGTSFCAGGSVNIVAEGSGTTSPFTYKWKRGTADVGTAAALAVTQAGTYTVEVTDKDGCMVSASVAITQTTNLPVSITGTNVFCSGQSTTLTANVTGGAAPFTYQWRQGTANVGTNANTYNANATGAYSVGVTDSKGCTGTSAAFSVAERPSPNVTVSTSRAPALLTGESVVLSVPAATGQTYQWLKDGVAVAGATNNTYTVAATNAGAYSVRVTNSSGCSATSSALMVSLVLSNEPVSEAIGLRVSPNPVLSQVQVVLTLAQPAAATLRVVDASGRRVRVWESSGVSTRHEVALDMRSVGAGSYVVQAETAGQVFVEKLVKQ